MRFEKTQFNFFTSVTTNNMKINSLRKLASEYIQSGLPVETRAYIKKELGRQDYNSAAIAYDSFLKSGILKEEPQNIVIRKVRDKSRAFANVRLNRNSERIYLITDLKKENILDTLSALKKLAKIPVNKHAYLFKESPGNIQVLQVPNTGNYRLISAQNGEIGVFSIRTSDGEISNFSISKKYRNTQVVQEALLAMKNFLENQKYTELTCAVELDKPHLVRMYEKFGFSVKGIWSINDEGKRFSFFELLKNYTYNIKIKFD